MSSALQADYHPVEPRKHARGGFAALLSRLPGPRIGDSSWFKLQMSSEFPVPRVHTPRSESLPLRLVRERFLGKTARILSSVSRGQVRGMLPIGRPPDFGTILRHTSRQWKQLKSLPKAGKCTSMLQPGTSPSTMLQILICWQR